MSGGRDTGGLGWALIIGAMTLGACSGERDQHGATAGPLARPPAELPAEAQSRTKASVLMPLHGGFVSRPKREGTLQVGVPAHADGTIELTTAGASLGLTSEGAANQQGEVADGRVVYRDCFTDTDVVIAAHGSRFEELRVLRSAKAPTTARYRLKATGPVRVENGVVEVLDASGRTPLRTLPAWAIDATGRKRALRVDLDRDSATPTLVVELDPKGLSFPIVVDPTWVAGADWPSETVVALNSVWLKEHSTVASTVNGAVAVLDASAGPVLADDAEAVVGQNVTVNGTVSANRVRIKLGGVVAADVRSNTLVNNGTVGGATLSPLTLPLPIHSPVFPVFAPGTTAVTLEQGEDRTLAAGAYAEILLKMGSASNPTVLTLGGGTYDIANLNLGDRSRVECVAPCELRIRNRLEPGQGAYIGPATGSGLGAAEVEVFVEGLNGSSGALGATPKAAAIGFDNVVRARMFVPNGTLWLKQGTVATGTFVARDVIVGEGVSLTKDTSGTCGPVDDGNPCTADTCDGATGTVHHDPLPAGSACADPDPCNGTELCDGAGACQAGTAPVVDDGNPCTTDACSPTKGVTHSAVQNGTVCSDGDPCTQNDTCQAGVCTSGNPVLCAASDQCHDAGTCDPNTGACSNPAKANGTACDDDNACTEADTCQSGACAGGVPVVCTALDQCHEAGTCNPTTGVCSNPPKPDGASCDDGNGCTQSDSCEAGVCTGSSPVVCTATDQCHAPGSCNPATGSCSNPARQDGTSCDDDNACTSGETCVAGSCGGGAAVALDDGNPCTADACDPNAGVTHTALSAGTSCSDGNACNGSELCDGAGNCLAGSPVAVDDGNPCTSDACDPASGVSHLPVPAGTACDDADLCMGDRLGRRLT